MKTNKSFKVFAIVVGIAFACLVVLNSCNSPSKERRERAAFNTALDSAVDSVITNMDIRAEHVELRGYKSDSCVYFAEKDFRLTTKTTSGGVAMSTTEEVSGADVWIDQERVNLVRYSIADSFSIERRTYEIE